MTRTPHAKKGASKPRHARPHAGAPAPRVNIWDLDALALLVPVLLGVVFLTAPAESNYFWAVNGLRSLAPKAAACVVFVALAAAFLALIRTPKAPIRWVVVILATWVIAFPMREKIHFLGDTQMRVRSMSVAGAGWIPLFGSWWARLHANPLDIVVNILGISALQALGSSVIQAASVISWILGVLFVAGCWRLAGRLSADSSSRWGLTAAIALSGVLLAFAGYAESAGLVAVTAIWWWAEMLAPLTTRGQALRTTGAFIALVLAHRVGVVMAIPLVWRAVGPALEKDEPNARRQLLVFAIVAIVLVAVMTLATSAGHQLAVDARDLLASARAGRVHPSDILNALALVAPLALMAPFVAGRVALAGWLRSPAAAWILLASVPLLIALEWLYPTAGYTLGPQREWESNLMPGITLTVAAASILSRLHPARLRAVLGVLVLVLGLGAASWIAVNADAAIATRRALMLVERPSTLTPFQTANLHAYLGQRAMDIGDAEAGGRHFELAFDIGGNSRRALMASEAWLLNGSLAGARNALAKARSRGALGPELAASARRLDEMIAGAAADSARSAAADSARSAAADSARRTMGEARP